jgi:trans-aconitate 2-methyltransferase
MPTDAWDPAIYHRFRAERRQPFDDLLALLRPVPGGSAADLGCGSGELTADLHRHLGARETVGVDSSAAMLRQAGSVSLPGVRFERADLATWVPSSPLDVLAANASLQWVGDHPALMARLAGLLGPSGQLAVQIPDNFDHPTHTVADRVGRAFGMEPVSRFEAVLAPEAYAGLLDRLGFADIHVRMQVYVHRLPNTASVIDWVRGTLLTEYRRALTDERYEEFLEHYRHELLDELGDPGGERPDTHLFKRILFRAHRGRVA